MGAYPEKALGVLRSVATRMEEWVRDEKYGAVVLPQIAETPDGRVSEEVGNGAAVVLCESWCCGNVPLLWGYSLCS